MKKVFFEKAAVFSACLVLGLCMITGCSNFLNGSNLKESIDEEIARVEEEKKLANTPRVNVRLELERTAYGKLTPQDDYTAIVGVPFFVEFKINNVYVYDGYRVVNQKTGDIAGDDVFHLNSFEEVQDGVQYTYKYSFTITKATDSLLFTPLCHIANDVTAPKFTGDFLIAGTKEKLSDVENNLKNYDPEDYTDSFVNFLSPVTHNNHVSELFIKCSVEEADSSNLSLLFYEYSLDISGEKFGREPVISSINNCFAPDGKDKYTANVRYELATGADEILKLVVYVKDGAGNICTDPKIYYLAKDTRVSSNLYYECPEISNQNIESLKSLSLTELIDYFSEYRVATEIEDLHEVFYGYYGRDLVTNTYEFYTENNTFVPLDVSESFEPTITVDMVEKPAKKLAKVQFSPETYDTANGVTLRINSCDEVGNQIFSIYSLPGSVSFTTAREIPGESDCLELEKFGDEGAFTGTFIFYNTDTDASVKFADGLKIQKHSSASVYNIYCVSYDEKGNTALLTKSVLSVDGVFNTPMYCGYALDDLDAFDELTASERKSLTAVSLYTLESPNLASYEFVQLEGKEDLFSLKIDMGEAYSNFDFKACFHEGKSNSKHYTAVSKNSRYINFENLTASMIKKNEFI